MLYEGTKSYISALSDEELLEYLVVGTEEYDPDAVLFAQGELQRRKLSDHKVDELAAEALLRIDEKEWATEDRAKAPLSKAGKLLWFALGSTNILAFGLLLIVSLYADRGDSRKARQMFYGLCSGFTIEILIYFQHENGTWIGPLSVAAGLIFAGYLYYVAKTRPYQKTAGFAVIPLSSQPKNLSN